MPINFNQEIDEKVKALSSLNDGDRNKFFLLNDIIQLKNLSGNSALIATTYSDIKEYFSLYIKYLDKEKFNYDRVNLPKLFELIENLPPEQRIELLRYLKDSLKKSEISFSDKDLIREIRINEIKYLSKNISPKNIFPLILKCTSFNLVTLLIGLFLFIVIECIILLPSPFENIGLFKIEYDTISQVFVINHFLNIIGGAIELTDNFKITPLNEFGFVLLFVGKLFFIVIVLNYIIKEIKNKVDLK